MKKTRSFSVLTGLALACAMGFTGSTVDAATVTFPDLSGGGTFTLDAGDDTTLTATTSIADNALAVLNINGTWNSGGNEVQLGGVNGQWDGAALTNNLDQDVTLNIGSTGVVNWSSTWFAAGWPGNTTDPLSTRNCFKYGPWSNAFTVDGTGFGIRSKGTSFGGGGSFSASGTGGGSGQNVTTLFEYLFDGGLVSNTQVSSSFAEAFTITGRSPTSAYTITANAAVSRAGLAWPFLALVHL